MRRILLVSAAVLSVQLAGCAGSNPQPAAPVVAKVPAPVVTLNSSSPMIEVGQTVVLSWTSTDANVCAASGDWTGDRAISGDEVVTIGHAGPNSYTLTCNGDGGSGASTVSVNGTPVVTPNVPTLTLSSSSPTATVGKSVTLTWTSTDAHACDASGDWSGAKAANDHESVTVSHNGPNTYTLTCHGAGGSIAQTVSVAGVTVYELAGGCYAMKAVATNQYVTGGSAGYSANGTDPAAAEHFFMQAAGLVRDSAGALRDGYGRYIFYAHDQRFMTATPGALPTDATTVTGETAPADGSDWLFTTTDNGHFVIGERAADGQKLATDSANGNLVMSDTAADFVFEARPLTECTAYPEMPVDIGPTYKGNGVDKPVIGFAEVHTHMAMGSEMSDGAPENHVGPSAGGVMYGQAVNRFGVIEALKNCSGPHGENGALSPEWSILDGGDYKHAQHDTQGWPTFVDWPKGDSQLHQQMYWRWLERAYRAGLRIMTVHGTNIEALCNVAKETGGNKDASLMDEDCTDMGVGMKQVAYLSVIQDYIDAQNGGPGKGWFRIAKDPHEAREIINEGKLAVVPGLEFSNMFGCNVTFNPDGTETDGCTREQIDAGVENVWNKGVRQIIPFHDVDSALGGTGIFSSVLNEIGFLGTHGFWKMYPCPDGGEGEKYFYAAGAVMESSNFTQFNDPITQAVMDRGTPLPVYGPGRQCNARGLTDLGKYALQKIMAKGFVLDIDHAELSIKQNMLDMGAKTTPNYPMLSAHGGHGGISMAQAEQTIRQGGVIYPALPDGREFNDYVRRLKPIWDKVAPQRLFAVGYGADSNGLRNLPGPRGGTATRIQYPFNLFSGDGWGPQYAAAGIGPIEVKQLTIPVPGGQTWNPDDVGTAHYGLVADFVEAARIEGGQQATDALYNSAEAYLRMWEQVRQAAVDAAAHPPTP